MTLDSLHTEGITSSNGHKAKSMLARIQSAKDIASSIRVIVKCGVWSHDQAAFL